MFPGPWLAAGEAAVFLAEDCGLRFLTVEAPPGAARPPLGDFPTLVAEAGPGILLDNRNRTQKWDESDFDCLTEWLDQH